MQKLFVLLVLCLLCNYIKAQEGKITHLEFGCGFDVVKGAPGASVEFNILGLTTDVAMNFKNYPHGESVYGSGYPLSDPNSKLLLFGYEIPCMQTKKGFIKITPLFGCEFDQWYMSDLLNGDSVIWKSEKQFAFGGKFTYYVNDILNISVKGDNFGGGVSVGLHISDLFSVLFETF